jgi:PAS domain S-box-containing protein
MRSGNPRILAVDDLEAKRYAWERVLTRAGFDVFTASSGNEALRRSKENPDLIILDVRLPDIGGIEVCRKIKDEPSTASIPVLHISASLITSEDRTRALESGADGYLTEPVDPEELVASVRALLRMRSAEDSARKLAAEWQSTFDAIQDGVVVVDSAGRIARCNRAFVETTGKPCADLVGRDLRDVLVKHLMFEDSPLFLDLAAGGGRRSGELRWGDRWIRVTFDPIRNGKEYTGSTGIFSDVTARIAAEQEVEAGRQQLNRLNAGLEERVAERTRRLQHAVQELEAFSYTIAHDLRAPLRAMHRFSEVLIEEYGPGLDDEGRSYARRIIAGAEKMDLLINDLLKYSKLTQSEIRPQRISTGPLIAEVLRQLHPDAAAPEPEVVIEEPLPDLTGDRVLLSQVFLNLLSNAMKFVKPGTRPRIRVTGERRDGLATVSILDNGIGVEAESQSRLFRVFERLGAAKEYPGTGIGLAVVRRAMERMGGEYGVESGWGEGSRFWIRLPVPNDEGQRL